MRTIRILVAIGIASFLIISMLLMLGVLNPDTEHSQATLDVPDLTHPTRSGG
jgi:hypothetical protein